MFASQQRNCRLAYSDSGIATMAEYILLLAVSLTVFLSLFAAFSVAATTAENDAMAIAAENVASAVSTAICDVTGDGTISASTSPDLPSAICGRPYLVYPSADGRQLIVSVNRAGQPRKYTAPLLLRMDGVRIAGFIVSAPGEERVAYDAATRTVTIS